MRGFFVSLGLCRFSFSASTSSAAAIPQPVLLHREVAPATFAARANLLIHLFMLPSVLSKCVQIASTSLSTLVPTVASMYFVCAAFFAAALSAIQLQGTTRGVTPSALNPPPEPDFRFFAPGSSWRFTMPCRKQYEHWVCRLTSRHSSISSCSKSRNSASG